MAWPLLHTHTLTHTLLTPSPPLLHWTITTETCARVRHYNICNTPTETNTKARPHTHVGTFLVFFTALLLSCCSYCMDPDPLTNITALGCLSHEHEMPIVGSHSDNTTAAISLNMLYG